MRGVVVTCVVLILGLGSSIQLHAEPNPEMTVNLKPARRQPASVDPARPFKGKNHGGPKSLKADAGRVPANLRMSPRKLTPILDIDVSIKDE